MIFCFQILTCSPTIAEVENDVQVFGPFFLVSHVFKGTNTFLRFDILNRSCAETTIQNENNVQIWNPSLFVPHIFKEAPFAFPDFDLRSHYNSNRIWIQFFKLFFVWSSLSAPASLKEWLFLLSRFRLALPLKTTILYHHNYLAVFSSVRSLSPNTYV